MTYTLHLGDCIDAMRAMPDNSVDSIVTDPPYGLRFMGRRWDYDVPSVDIWAECLRVLKPGGHLLAFAGTRTQHRMAVRIEDAGFEIRDMIAWVYGSGFPKSRNIGNDVDGMAGWGTALKPALEPVTVARKPLIGTVAANVLAHGTGALNIDGCRVGSEVVSTHSRGANGAFPKRPGEKSAEESGRKKDQRDGLDHSERVGRWPANLVHDGSPVVLEQFPDAPGQLACASTNSEARKTQNAYGAMRRGRGSEPSADSSNAGLVGFRMKPGERRMDSGSAARFFYCAKASRADRNDGLSAGEQPAVTACATMREREQADWPKRNGNHHPTVKPTDLMAYLLRLVTPPGGTALDPFMGSGSTGKAAMREGFEFIGCELDPEYLAIAKARIEHELAKVTAAREQPAESQLSLFGS
ncbi:MULTISPECIES: DNA-methyltransferase [unclassified Pseudomonas]|uniref:DNA-methyltransferase n=1 Tax=unclassified Pseudomonas TaxID=196821 RepID=UPI0021BAD51F|nr:MULTISPECIES: site-specific DNA-methyltransferase [unclassified Pseudomonas]MCT8166875.1 site-specific DNA-methyltransferase [Pseudomonas sp. HD6422]MCT8185755.1 site-specific DNA-methyltransferase [Pseudomonas sp. HD6421]